MREQTPVLEVDGIGKSFGRTTVLKAASYAAHEGRVTALMGRNGAGKSTLLRITVGRVRADFGRVAYKGRFLRRPSLSSLARSGLLYASQESTHTALFTVGEHLRAVARVFGGEGRIEGVVADLGLEPFLDRRRGQISGGERKRAALGMALVRAPECLLMDEPFAGVAPRDRPLISEGIHRLREGGTAVVISGHDVEDLFAVSDEVIWVTAGTSHWLGSPADAAAHHQFRKEYLGPSRRPGASP